MSKSESAKKNEDWMNTKWRPAMGWMYMTVCVFDFILFPILWAVVQFWETQAANDAFRQWTPLTLQGAGLFHMAMGAVLGITAYSRGKEKMAGVASESDLSASAPTSTPSYAPQPPRYTPQTSSYAPRPVTSAPRTNIKGPEPEEDPEL